MSRPPSAVPHGGRRTARFGDTCGVRTDGVAFGAGLLDHIPRSTTTSDSGPRVVAVPADHHPTALSPTGCVGTTHRTTCDCVDELSLIPVF